MKPFLLSLAMLSLVVVAWQFSPSYRATPHGPSDAAATAIDFTSLRAEARGAMERLREKRTTRLTMNERGAQTGYTLR